MQQTGAHQDDGLGRALLLGAVRHGHLEGHGGDDGGVAGGRSRWFDGDVCEGEWCSNGWCRAMKCKYVTGRTAALEGLSKVALCGAAAGPGAVVPSFLRDGRRGAKLSCSLR